VIVTDLNDFGCFVERHFAHRSAALALTDNPEFESAKLSQTVGDFIVQRMHEWGVRRIFG
jgi:hypothetical protein